MGKTFFMLDISKTLQNDATYDDYKSNDFEIIESSVMSYKYRIFI